MKVFDFIKLAVLSATLSRAYLFADTYRLEVVKEKQTIRFCVHNFARKGGDRFFVKKVGGAYETGDGSTGNCIYGMSVGTGVSFNFGSFHAVFDDKSNQLNLCGGCFTDTLLLEKADYPIVVAKATALHANTIVVKDIGIFKNEGIFEAFITVLQDCKTVENRGKFHARNLFLFKTDIQNCGMVQWDDIFKAIGGKIIPKVADLDFPEKKGFIGPGVPTGNTKIFSLHKTYHKKTVVCKSQLQLKELTDGSLNVCDFWGRTLNYVAVLVGSLNACDGNDADSGITLNFYPGSCFVVNAPVVIGSGVMLNLGCSDNPPRGNFKGDTINVQSDSVLPLNNPKGGSAEGIWISPFNGSAPLFPDFDTVRTYQAHETKELILYVIYGT